MACPRPAELACIDHTSAKGTRETGRLVSGTESQKGAFLLGILQETQQASMIYLGLPSWLDFSQRRAHSVCEDRTWEAGNFPSSPPDSSPPDHNDETQRNERCSYHDKDLTYIHAQAPSDCIHPQSETGSGQLLQNITKKGKKEKKACTMTIGSTSGDKKKNKKLAVFLSIPSSDPRRIYKDW
ncbi:predicted protein [Histoplasma capsulatum var. duboisii H88]|uniref:Predicted protein n=1 Tax=Ajellomyces capsulatus (strain H88) TaxID=544711 RepID=F0URJ6_AJEC8|nr:predicted protein [Histoplasma capsulatum var. duboisii H88]